MRLANSLFDLTELKNLKSNVTYLKSISLSMQKIMMIDFVALEIQLI